MRAVRFVGQNGSARYGAVLAEKGVVVANTLRPTPNIRIRFQINGHPLHVVADRTVRDFLDMACILYVLDELEQRELSSDYWTRDFELLFPVHDPDRWTQSTSSLSKALNTLTGDRFAFEWIGRGALPHLGKHRYGLPREFEAVCLFSGGVDSLLGAYQLLSQGTRVLLVGHQAEGATAAAQKRLFEHVQRAFPRLAYLIQCRVARAEGKGQRFSLPPKVEETHRPRSFLFLALAVTIARQAGIATIYMPENGLIALNPPLQKSRLGSLTTRTAHPKFLIEVLKFMSDAGVFAGALRNPFLFLSKTDMLRALPAPLREAALESNSCARPTRYQNYGVRHCGYCMPCVYRRVAMMECGLDAATHYAFDVFRELANLTSIQQADFRALVGFARTVSRATPTQRGLIVMSHGVFSAAEASALGPSPAADLSPWADMVQRWADDFLSKLDACASAATKRVLRVAGAKAKR